MPLLRFRTIAFALLCSWFLSTSFRAASEQVETKAIELADIMAWSSITGTALSEDGEWFGYRVGPTEGDSEVIVLQTKGNQQYKFNVGEIPVPEPALPGA